MLKLSYNRQMKVNRIFILLSLGAIISLNTSCVHTRSVSFNAMRPAEITMSPEIQKLLVVNRTKYDNKAKGIVEGVLTGEMPGDDRKGIEEALITFKENTTRTSRFEVEIAKDTLSGNSVMNDFPAPISWEIIEALCKKYDSDLLIAAELFDTDFRVTSRQANVSISDGPIPIPKVQFHVMGDGKATIGFRIYDPVERIIVDQQLITRAHHWEASGSGLAAARAGIVGRSEGIKYVSGMVGGAYATKIAPMPVRVTRRFYGKRKRSSVIAIGGRYGDVNQWDKAIETWEGGLPNAKRKMRGFLSLNIAVGHEVLGDLDSAIEWAQKSHVESKNKLASDYVRRLRNRVAAEQVLDEQL